MNLEHVSLVRTLYDSFARGDVPAVVAAFDPQIHWREAEGYSYAEGNPYVGPDAVLQGIFARLGGEWDNFTVTPKEFVATDQGVVTFGRYTGTFKASGRAVDAEFAHVWTVRDGKVHTFRQFTDTAQFRAVMQS
jgi:uncharacterized protein